MKREIALALAIVAGFGSAECCAEDGGITAPAEQALRVKLEQAYPTVTRWEIGLLPASQEPAADAGTLNARGQNAAGDHPSIVVTRVGERSAVWVGSPMTAERRRGSLLWFNVAGYGPALVAAHAIAAADSLDPHDATAAERDVVAADCPLIADRGALAGMRAKRLLRAGDIICSTLLEPVPPVSRGKEVTLLYVGRSFTLTARGIAQGDGLLGKPVTVRNSSSGDVLTATVSGQAEVSVHE
jgi:flagella basal body P-ring formation protein FlgA